MSIHDEPQARWHLAAQRAPFALYEPENGSDRWAGGFAVDGTYIEVIALVDGDEVSVATSRPARAMPEDLRHRDARAQLLWQYVMEDVAEVALPYSVTIEADDRSVAVDSEMHTVHGMRIAGDSRWVGILRLGDVAITITTASRAALSLRRCRDPASLPESPPIPGDPRQRGQPDCP
jgi:hypothetical protein